MHTPQLPPKFFSLNEEYALYQPIAEFTKEGIVESIDDVILYCRENAISGLLVDITGATGLPTPSVSDIFWFITKFAETSAGRVAIAMVAPKELITPDKIGITIAKNRGLLSEIFTNKTDAGAWLLSELARTR